MRDVERFIVAIGKLATDIDVEAKELANDLGVTAYETRLKLAAGLPAIVLSTTDGDAANELGGKLRARKHRAMVVRASDVVAVSAMTRIRRFDLEPDALVTDLDSLPWSDITALVRARHRTQSTSTEVKKEKKFDLGRAVASGGLVMRSTKKTEVVTHHENSEQVLYLFTTGTPWILREQGTNYAGLGSALEATANLNFGIACDVFRKRATGARYDDSLLRRPSVDDVDLYAHLLAI